MKEAIIKYRHSKVLDLLRSLSGYLDFSIVEKSEKKKKDKKVPSFTVLHVKSLDAKQYKFNRGEANER